MPRGRPKGSKNKPKTPVVSIQAQEVESVVEIEPLASPSLLSKMLVQLNKEPDIAKFLKSERCKGRSVSDDCPVAIWLSKQGVRAPGVSSSSCWSGEKGNPHLATPHNVEQFLTAFDLGRHPELERN